MSTLIPKKGRPKVGEQRGARLPADDWDWLSLLSPTGNASETLRRLIAFARASGWPDNMDDAALRLAEKLKAARDAAAKIVKEIDS